MELRQRIEKAKHIYVYGAQYSARAVLKQLMTLDALGKVERIIVSRAEGNPAEIYGIPVQQLSGELSFNDRLVLVAVSSRYFAEIGKALSSLCEDEKIVYCSEAVINSMGNAFPYMKRRYSELTGNRYELLEDPLDGSYQQLFEKKQRDSGLHLQVYWNAAMPDDEASEYVLRNFDLRKELGEQFGVCKLLPGREENPDDLLEAKKYFSIYQVTSHGDRNIVGADKNPLLTPIQAGAKLTSVRKCEITDATGDNISDRNGTMSEMTASYWVWKNSPPMEYKGICHYRRQFDSSPSALLFARAKGVDAILPTPRLMLPNVAEAFIRDGLIRQDDMDSVMDIIGDRYPEYLEDAKKHLWGHIFTPCNMLIAKSAIFDEYCGFVMPLVMRIDDLHIEKEIKSAARFAGYIGEIMTSLFFMHDREKYKIVFSDLRVFS